jgi:hypothetical protein
VCGYERSDGNYGDGAVFRVSLRSAGTGIRPPALKPYTFDDIVTALNTVQPYDWAGFLNQRLHSTSARAPLGGIEHSGWKLTYDNVRSDFWKAHEDTRKITDLTYSIGILIGNDDGISPTFATAARRKRPVSTGAEEGLRPMFCGEPVPVPISARVDRWGSDRRMRAGR